MTSSPRIAAYLGVKDEVELIEHSIAHLRAIGVDYVMVCDMSSTDGTAEILESYRSETFSILTLTNEANRPEQEDDWYSHSFRWCQSIPADWVIFLDADEFWLPASGSLKDCQALPSTDVLLVERYNVVLGPDGPLAPTEIHAADYDQILLFAERIPDLRLQMQKDASLPWIAGAVLPKIMARPSKIEGLAEGLHGVIDPKGSLNKETPSDLIIAHLALSTRTRFARKLENVRAVYEEAGVDLTQPVKSWQNYGVAWHWRRWATLTDSDAEFERNITGFDRIAEMRRRGAIKSAREMLTPPA